MKIALCSKGNFSLEKGFTKNRIELAQGLEGLGWNTTLVDKKLLGIPEKERYNALKHSLALKQYLQDNYYEFDVILYEYDTLPFNRDLFNPKTLFVARPAILAYHFSIVKFKHDLKTRLSLFTKEIKDLVFANKEKLQHQKRMDFSLSQSDLIQVQNKQDRDMLIFKGYAADRIIIIPNGIHSHRILKFNNITIEKTFPLQLAFVGTFDFRKGAMDFGPIFTALKEKFPEIRLKLLGTGGLFATKEEVLKFFPRKHHPSIEVHPKFKADNLPELLKGCHAGIFPSYLESFGFGALEMMCAGLPVVAYNVPGPSDFILPELLITRGNWKGMAHKITEILQSPDILEELSKRARNRVVKHYCWENIAKTVDEQYRYFHSNLQNENSGVEKNFNKNLIYKA
ncbi:glycosyltransferase involved in cell wall biosynthesis [Gillisia mitskevichiae]|uniref:Glycosyltransferase involved in cell wall biosynthesis n=1 Tax=Gillisia mitskevichiae TaxID=270921 RepID=A0A495PTR1_9FLAO|nr:glycosyltransferase family 4 protein [Gillisia mitskevichiae]RKS53951.1 glycosyltransferase involved in cell wall biosynthesis [Gillisia mitskevichiae]